MIYKRKSKLGTIIKIIIVITLILFVYACYNVDYFKNNKYVVMVKAKISETMGTITNNNGSLSSLIENYEPDNEDNTVYEITDIQNRYYYNQLDENSKIIYAEILENVDKIKNGEDNIRISSKLSSLASSEDMQAELMNSFQNAWDAFRNDNVDIFYIDGSKMCLLTKTIKRGKKVNYEFYISKGKNSNYLIDEFSTSKQVDDAIMFVEKAENEILQTVTEKNDYHKIVKIHNWIIDNLQYNLQESDNNSNIYGALKEKKVVCEGYARLFKSLMDKLEIPCVLVSGEGIDLDTGNTENHAWNYVYLKGNWYAIDSTWDDPVIIGSGTVDEDIKYRYFLKGSEYFDKSHVPDGNLVENGMEFIYPELSVEDYVKEK
ncbi:MAG: hypothetical protein J6A89_05030 [Clostridia bacterium]|nr:hypothetical protein [Clostridia bacterium]